MLIVMCGAPGSGKTTMAEYLAYKHKATVYHFDELDKCASKSVDRQSIRYIIATELRDGKDVVYDDLNLRLDLRKQLLNVVRDIPCKKILVVMNTPLEECLLRNSKRPRRLPDQTVRTLYTKYEPPTLDEGWDEIRKVKTYEPDFTGN